MNEDSAGWLGTPGSIQDSLTELLRRSARGLIEKAVEAEWQGLLDQYENVIDLAGTPGGGPQRLPARAGHPPRRGCMKFGWLRPRPKRTRLSTASLGISGPNTPRRSPSWPRIERSDWPFTTFRPSTGFIFAPPTRSNPPLPPSVTARLAPRTAYPETLYWV